MGGHYPVRIQSMTTTPTMNTLATIEQSIRMINAGCEYVRITAPGVKEAENLRIIKKELRKRGYKTPIIADIHYQPQVAEIAAKYVEKIRINPGNYVDRKRGKATFSDAEYKSELEKIHSKIKPLIRICKEHNTVIRIGSNHGSLSERILMAYGDTPLGMVESALEFVKICEDLDFFDMVLSMKSSNVKVMMYANRLLVKRMMDEGKNYPVHLGVTEAGDAEDGRIKSSAGIGPLLVDGIGDTVRVSLTEDPEFEIPVAKKIARYYSLRNQPKSTTSCQIKMPETDPFQFIRRETNSVDKIGGNQPPVVILKLLKQTDLLNEDQKPDYTADTENKNLLKPSGSRIPVEQINPVFIRSIKFLHDKLKTISPSDVFVFDISETDKLTDVRCWFGLLNEKKCRVPVLLKKSYPEIPEDELMVKASVDFSYFLADGYGDGIWIDSSEISPNIISTISFGLLQAIGARISKTEYIACPSCGRTLFNIQQTLQQIKSRTSHLKGLKIGVMGCCVNGPGEMADAHYGYVGAGKGKITLYKGKQIIKAGINESVAVEELISLIKANGDWV